MSLKVSIQSRSGRNFGEYTVDNTTTVRELKQQFANKNPKYYPDRQRLLATNDSGAPTVMLDEKKVSEYVSSGGTITFRDLGPQFSYRGVFFLEYLGPLLGYLFTFLFPRVFYGVDVVHTDVQKLAALLHTLHYVKREYETFFVHRFSHGTMPLFNLFKNFSYYFGCGTLMGYFINHPLYTPAPYEYVVVGAIVFVLSELGNGLCHLMLRQLRPKGTTQRGLPRGFLFELVDCPNYTFEIMAWISFAIMTRTAMAWVFMLLGAGQMYIWAMQKHKKYQKEFGSQYPKGRKALIPFLL